MISGNGAFSDAPNLITSSTFRARCLASPLRHLTGSLNNLKIIQGYISTETEAHATHRSRHATLPDYRLPDVLIAGKRQTSEDAAQNILQPAANAEYEVAMSEVRGGERDPPMGAYELPADLDYAGTLQMDSSVSGSHQPFYSVHVDQDKSKRSSLLPDFAYLKPLITFTSSVSVSLSTPQVEDADDFAYLGQYVATGAHSPPVGTSSAVSYEENFSYVAKLIEVGQAPISRPSSRTSSSFPSSKSSAPSLSSTQSETSTTLSTAASLPNSLVGPSGNIALSNTPQISPPLRSKPPEYQKSAWQDLTPVPIIDSDLSEVYGAT